MLKEDIAAFLAAIQETPELWRSVDMRTVAVWRKDEWHNVVTLARLDARLPADIPRLENLPVTQRVAARQEVFPVESLPDVIKRIRVRGSLLVDGVAIRFTGDNHEEPFKTPYRNSHHRAGLSLDDYLNGPYLYGHSLMLLGGSVYQAWEHFDAGRYGLDAELRRAGWDGLDDLLYHGFGDVLAVPSNSSRRINFVAPLEVSLDTVRCRLQSGTLTYSVSASSKASGARAKLLITGIGPANQRIARNISLKDRRWVRRGGVQICTGTERRLKSDKIHISLQIAGYELGRTTVSDEGYGDARPLLMLAHETVWPGKRSFREVLLNPLPSEGRPFERAVGKLFQYCRLLTDHAGRIPEEQNGPDILVEVPERKLLFAIETTVAELMNDDGKMNRLTKRSADLRYALKDVGASVLPLMIVPSPRETLVPVELEGAEKNGVRVLCREDLEAIYNMAMSHSPTRQIVSYITREPEQPTSREIRLYVERNPLAE